MKKIQIPLFVFFILLLNSTTHSQSFGINFGSAYFSTYFYYTNSGTAKYFDIPLKNIFIEYSQDLLPGFRVSLSTGYGWNNFKYQEQQGNPSDQSIYTHTFELKSNGIPIELDFEYHKNLNADSTIESMIGIGAGYCNYKTKLTDGYNIIFESNLRLKGFSQYLNLGMSIRITRKIRCFVEIKKLILNNIVLSGDLKALKYIDNSSFTQSYAGSNGFLDVGLSIGINFRL